MPSQVTLLSFTLLLSMRCRSFGTTGNQAERAAKRKAQVFRHVVLGAILESAAAISISAAALLLLLLLLLTCCGWSSPRSGV